MDGFAVSLNGVSKGYRLGEQEIHALNDLDLGVGAGSAVAITGPSGSGKSTLLHVVGAMDTVDRGVISTGEFVVTSLTRKEQVSYRRKIGFVFQRFHLLPALTALDNVIAPLIPQKVDFDKFARGRELLDAVGLGDRAKSLPSELSGGQQQRVAIARALVNSPRLLLAEPTGNLDSNTGTEILNLIFELRAARGPTVLIATHDPIVAGRCDRTVVLRDGVLVDDTRPADQEVRPDDRTKWASPEAHRRRLWARRANPE